MKFKLDENFGSRTQNIFREFDHDVHTVAEEQLSGASDVELYGICCDEQRCFITLDLDFADVVRFPPENSSGIVVIRVPRNPSLILLERLVRYFLNALAEMQVENQLWIVELNRIRIHQRREF